MDWLLHNPLTNLNGWAFLVLYLVVIVATLTWFYYQTCDLGESDRPPPMIPEHPDPYEIAYLRSGARELVRVVVLSLIQRGYLEHQTEPHGFLGRERDFIARPPSPPDPRHLNEIEAPVYSYFYSRKPFADVFRSRPLLERLVEAANGYEDKLTDEGLLFSDEARATGKRYYWVAMGLIFGFGGYRVVTSLIKEKYNLGFLILEMIVGAGCLWLLNRGPRLSRNGVTQMKALETAFDGYRSSDRMAAGHSDEMLLLLASVYGPTVLTGSAYGYYPRLLKKADINMDTISGGSSSTCGSSCSSTSALSCGVSSCGSGSSCGSSCGGGGCGGCGGS